MPLLSTQAACRHCASSARRCCRRRRCWRREPRLAARHPRWAGLVHPVALCSLPVMGERSWRLAALAGRAGRPHQPLPPRAASCLTAVPCRGIVGPLWLWPCFALRPAAERLGAPTAPPVPCPRAGAAAAVRARARLPRSRWPRRAGRLPCSRLYVRGALRVFSLRWVPASTLPCVSIFGVSWSWSFSLVVRVATSLGRLCGTLCHAAGVRGVHCVR